MKIHNEQLQALQQQAEARAKPRAEGVFDAILNGQMTATQQGEQAVPGQPLNPAAALLQVESPAEAASAVESGVLAMVSQSIDTMLGSLDEYAETLASPQGADLRKAYGLLRGVDQDLAALSESAPDLATRHAGMASLVDEIAVITRAETVKLNRGDYL